MLTRILFLLSLALGITVLLTGAWTGSLSFVSPSPETDFVPQTVPLDAHIVGSGVDAKQLLQKALDNLDPKRTAWLKTKIRQTVTDTDSSFVAEGFLQRGPNHCARLDMTIGEHGRLLVVSDGDMLAQERTTAGEKPIVETEQLPPADSTARDAFLNAKCCGGPRVLLEQLHQHLHHTKLQTGMLQDMPAIQIRGDLSPDAMPVSAGAATPVRHAIVYLDAKTCWPHRLEWHGVDKSNTPRMTLRIEFLNPELNRELSAQECMRLFSYHSEVE